MRKLLILFAAVLIASPAFSQVKFGIKVGASTATVPHYDATTGDTNIEALKNAEWGFDAGIFLRLQAMGIFLQPEIDFRTNSYSYNVTQNAVTDVRKQTFNRVEIPILLGVKLGPLRLNAGPSATIPIGSPKALVNDPNWDKMYRGTTIGYQAGIGVDIFKTITLDARYGGSLAKKFGDKVSIGNQTFNLDQRQPYFNLSLGVMF